MMESFEASPHSHGCDRAAAHARMSLDHEIGLIKSCSNRMVEFRFGSLQIDA